MLPPESGYGHPWGILSLTQLSLRTVKSLGERAMVEHEQQGPHSTKGAGPRDDHSICITSSDNKIILIFPGFLVVFTLKDSGLNLSFPDLPVIGTSVALPGPIT